MGDPERGGEVQGQHGLDGIQIAPERILAAGSTATDVVDENVDATARPPCVRIVDTT
jgi:hypothetical protein